MRKNVILFLVLTAVLSNICTAQQKPAYTPRIEAGPCKVKIDPRLTAQCGYLVVPENRQKPAGRTIKIPFLYIRNAASDSINNVTLFTTGGPGYSTIANYDSITSNFGFLQFGGFIAFDQRGTRNSQPCLDCPEVNAAIKRAYKENRSKDKLVLEAVKQCRERFVSQGIDLSAYNTIESAADISDLRLALKIDSLTLYGISYSGGLMLTVARNHPQGVKALVLNSPLPGYVNYEEDALLNYNEALNYIFESCETDSSGDAYRNLRARFKQYFTSINGKVFTIPYAEKNTADTLKINYTKNELLDAVIGRINNRQLKTVPFVMNELIRGNHAPYVKEVLDGIFAGNNALSHGMRYSVYCSEQIAYSDEALVKKQDSLLPWLAGYPFNNVNHAICDCWKVKPEPKTVKTAVYSNIPVLLLTGLADPWCSPFYNRLVKRYMPNSQLLFMRNQAHGASFVVDGTDFLKMFMADPYRKIISNTKNVIVE
ncbi:MAG TPA: alpha/beta fold hydrolase [Chitinophagaceae bacterium]|nr:alpha/beta fold hydrolase [Chitinophagaceae bacterium]